MVNLACVRACRFGLLVFASCALCAPDELIIQNGKRIETKGPYQIVGDQVHFQGMDGQLYTLNKQMLRLDPVEKPPSCAPLNAVPEQPPSQFDSSLILTNGEVIELIGSYEIIEERLIYRSVDGEKYSIACHAVDFEQTVIYLIEKEQAELEKREEEEKRARSASQLAKRGQVVIDNKKLKQFTKDNPRIYQGTDFVYSGYASSGSRSSPSQARKNEAYRWAKTINHGEGLLLDVRRAQIQRRLDNEILDEGDVRHLESELDYINDRTQQNKSRNARINRKARRAGARSIDRRPKLTREQKKELNRFKKKVKKAVKQQRRREAKGY